MDSELEKLINNNVNLEDYLKEYEYNSLFLYHYYLQDTSRLGKNYYAYSRYIEVSDRIKLVYTLINRNSIDNNLNFILADLANLQFVDKYSKEIEKLFLYILDLVKKKKINLDNHGCIKGRIMDLDPIYFLNIDFDNIKYLSFLKGDIVLEILKLAVIKKYKFTEEDFLFVKYKIFSNCEALIFFINNCSYDDNIIGIITNYFDMLDRKEQYDIYSKINNDNLREFLSQNLNFDNYDIDTIVNESNIFLNVCNRYDEAFSFLSKIKKRNFQKNIILIMERIDMDFVDKAYQICGDNLRISPTMNQEHKKLFIDQWGYPYYKVEDIRRTERVLDLYAKTTCDTIDMDGDIKTLSPLEKYIAAYILTTKFAPYKKEDNEYDDYHISRSVYEFIDRTRDTRIVCVGYVHLLSELLYRMGLTETVRWDIHSNNEDEEENDRNNHARLIIHLVDPKYNIDGIYMSDPTWDEDFKKMIIEHMLMSKDELTKIDPELDEFDLRLLSLEQLKSSINISNINKLFNRPIPIETIIKAFVAIYHFLDKNMKMINNPNDCDILEYCEMAVNLGKIDIVRDNKEKIYNQMIKMSLSEIVNYYPNLVSIFISQLCFHLENDLEKLNIHYDLDINYSKNKKKMGIYIYEKAKSFDVRLLGNKYKYVPLDKRTIIIKICELVDKPINIQYQEIIDSIKQFNKDIYKVSSVRKK